LQLARNWDWHPRGANPADRKDKCNHRGKFTGDYDCDDWSKTVLAADAAALADALERTSKQLLPAPTQRRPVLLRDAMTSEEYRMANAELGTDFLAEFIIFLRKGEFSFFWDD